MAREPPDSERAVSLAARAEIIQYKNHTTHKAATTAG